jgi:hypothetical protein
MWMFVVFEYVFSVCYLYLRTCTITVVPLLLFFCDACSFVGSCVVVARARLRLRVALVQVVAWLLRFIRTVRMCLACCWWVVDGNITFKMTK